MKTLCFACTALLFSFATGCGSSAPPVEEPAPSESEETTPPDGEPEQAEHPTLSAEECEAQGGELVGDIGDGATHRPDYVCPSGAPPIGTVPLGIEGSVCCP